MAKFLLSTRSFYGHVNPVLPLARQLVERGHDVWWHTGEPFHDKVEATGAYHVLSDAMTELDTHMPEDVGGVKEISALEQSKATIRYIFVSPMMIQYQDFVQIQKEIQADVLIAEWNSLGAFLFHEKNGLPWATLNNSVLFRNDGVNGPYGRGLPPARSAWERWRNRLSLFFFGQVILKDLVAEINQYRASLGLRPLPRTQPLFNCPISPFLFLQPTVESFEYHHPYLPPQFHFIGPMLPSTPDDFTLPTWWHELEQNRPVIHITQGTVATAVQELILSAIKALADEDVFVVITTGGRPVADLPIHPLPANFRVESYIPHGILLPHVDVMVTNAGYNGVQTALAAGVPLVVAGRSEDKAEVCARVARAGLGVDLRTQTPSSEQIRNAVQTVLGDSTYRQKARQIQAEMRNHNAPLDASILLEQLAATKKPVLRTSLRTESSP